MNSAVEGALIFVVVVIATKEVLAGGRKEAVSTEDELAEGSACIEA